VRGGAEPQLQDSLLIQVDLDGAIAAQTAYQKSRSKRGDSVGPEYKAAVAATDEFFGKAKKALAAHLGDQWNESWIEAGFVNRSTRSPKPPAAGNN